MRVKYLLMPSLLYGLSQNIFFISCKSSEDNRVVSRKDSWGSLKRIRRAHWYDTTSVWRSSQPYRVSPKATFTVWVQDALEVIASHPSRGNLLTFRQGKCKDPKKILETEQLWFTTFGFSLAEPEIAPLLFPEKNTVKDKNRKPQVPPKP